MDVLHRRLLLIAFFCNNVLSENNIVWHGGGMKCENKIMFFIDRKCETKNIIATKAVTTDTDILVMTPRFKSGVPATVWRLLKKPDGVHLMPLLDHSFHVISDCSAVQNTVDFHLDTLGNLWILDTGMVDTLKNAKCTCHPKVLVLNVFVGEPKVKTIDLSSVVQPDSVLQTLVVEYRMGSSPCMYVADAGVGRVIVHDVISRAQWTVNAGAPAPLIQLALVNSNPGYNTLVAVKLNEPGWVEAQTAGLRQNDSNTQFIPKNQHMPPLRLLGSDHHYIFFRYLNSAHVFAWKVRHPITKTSALLIHEPEPPMRTASVELSRKKNYVILDTNFEDFMKNAEPVQKLSFVARIKSKV